MSPCRSWTGKANRSLLAIIIRRNPNQGRKLSMSTLTDVFNAGAANAYLFVPSAILLGALHGLEPGHSKTMMAAFIVAIRGTVAQAVLLGVAATISHTAIVWLVALAGLYFGSQWNTQNTEPYLQIVVGSAYSWRRAVDDVAQLARSSPRPGPRVTAMITGT